MIQPVVAPTTDPDVTIMNTGDPLTVTLPETPEGYTVTGDASAVEGSAYTFTVTPNKGWSITAVKYTVTGGDSEQTLTGEGTTYTIPADKVTGAITISVTAARITHNLTVTVDTPANVKTLTYSVVGDADKQDQALTSGTPVTVNEGDSLTLKIEPADGYGVEVKKGEAPLTGTDNVYTVSEVTGDVEISVTTSKNSYTVTEDITNKTAADLAEIEYQDNCVTGDAAKKIAKGTALKFTVKAAENADLTGKKVEVSYKIGATGDATPLTAVKDIYTVEAAKITDDITITVTVRALADCVVTLDTNPNIKAQYAAGAAITENDWKDMAATATVKEDEKFWLKLTANKYFKITEVKAGEEVQQGDRNGVYTFTVTEAVTITVKTELDANQCNTLSFGVVGDKDSATAVLSVSANDVGNLDGTAIEENKNVLVPNDAVSLKITPGKGYGITKINGKDVTPNEAGEVDYEVKFTSKKMFVKVTTDAQESVSENNITFVNNARNLTYKVTGDDKIEEVAKDKYVAKKDGKKLQFTVTAVGSYEPVVTRTPAKEEGADEEPAPVTLTPVKTTPSKTGAAYDYVVAASLLINDTITIDQREIQKTVTLSGDTANVDVSASVDGKTRKPDDANANQYTLLQNDTIALRITAKANVGLVKVTSQVGEAGKVTAAKVTNGVATLEVKAADSATVTIETADLYTASRLKNKDGVELPVADAKKNAYNVSYDGTYTANVVKGAAATAVNLSDVKVLLGKNPVAPAEGKGAVGSVTSGTTATINLGNAAASAISGKALTVELYAKEGTEEKDVKVGSYTLNVDVLVKDIKIDKKAALSVKQAIDTEKTYTVTAAKGVDLSRLNDTKEDADSIIESVVYEKTTGKLTVKVKAGKDLIGKKATVTIAESGAAADAAKATIEIEAAALISDATKEPGVKLVAATDVSLKLALSSDKKIEKAASDNLYYKVDTKRSQTISGNTIEDNKKTTYVKRTGDSQNALITVSDSQLGKGSADTYKVTATLVHTKNEPTADAEVTEENLLGASKTSKEQVLKTQTPAYEDKLKLKKGASTIATGQKNVVIATPQFNKYTTYLSLKNSADAAEDVSFSGDRALTVEAVENAGDIVIKASATANTALGKHTIQVTAAAEDGAIPSTATVVVTVVRGIHGLAVTVPSEDIYKPVKKAATLKATVIYNDDPTGKNKDSQPKNKKVQWSAVAVDASGNVQKDSKDQAVAFDGVTVKNGTVTVNKDYIIKGDETAPENDQFRIMVTADNTEKAYAGKDDQGKAIVGYSPVITITNQGADLNTIVLVGKDNKVIAQSVRGSKDEVSVTASALNGATVKVLPAGVNVTTGENYAAENDEIKTENLSYKSNKAKDVAVGNDGTLTVTKANTKATLTVTANDGSKAKIDMKLNVGYDTVEAAQTLGLLFYPLEVEKSGNNYAEKLGDTALNAKADDIAITYAGTTRLAAKVMVKTGESWSAAKGFENYEIKVTGGTKPELSAGMAKFTAQKKAVTVTLTDKSKATQTPVVYTLTSSDIDEITKEKVTAKTAGNLHKEGKASEQKVTINLEMPKALGDKLTGKKTAVVDLDWTKMNAKNSADLYYFRDSLTKTTYEFTNLALDSKGTKYTASFDLSFKENDNMYFAQNSYALKVTVGNTTTGDSGDTFAPIAAPAAAAVKVDKTKAFTFAPTTSYTLLKKDMKASATLTGRVNVSADEYTVSYSGADLGLQNMNTKGVTNKFTEYFEISADGKQIQLIKGKEVPTKENLTGYLTYKAEATKGYLANGKGTGVNTVKITVKIDDKKTAATYSQSASGALPKIGNVKDQETTVNILSKEGKNPADWAELSYAAVKSDDNVSKNFEAAVTGSDGGIKLTYKGDAELTKGSTLSIKLFIVPTNSYYTDEIAAKNSDKAAQNQLIEKYGIAVTVKVKVTEVKSPADTAKAALEAWLTKVNTDQPTWLKNDLDTAAKLIAKINDAEAGAKLGDGVTVAAAKKTGDSAEQDDYTLAKATLEADGSITGNLTVTVAGADPVTVALNLDVPKGAITKDEAKTAVQDAETVKGYEVTNTKISAEGKEAASNEICALAQAVLGEKYYTVSVKTQLAGTDAVVGTAGSATITLTIKEAGNGVDTGVDTDAISYEIAALQNEG